MQQARQDITQDAFLDTLRSRAALRDTIAEMAIKVAAQSHVERSGLYVVVGPALKDEFARLGDLWGMTVLSHPHLGADAVHIFPGRPELVDADEQKLWEQLY